MKRFRIYLLRLLAALLTPVLVYLLFSVLLSLLTTRPAPVACTEKQEVYISTNGVHLEIIFPTSQLQDSLFVALQVPSGVEYVSFGWGDKQFYLQTPTWDQLTLSTALKAAFLRSETALHVTRHYDRGSSWRPLRLCDRQVDSLRTYIWQSFQQDTQGQLLEIPNAGYTRHDFFYEATGNYTLFHTCNNWVNIALKKASVKTALWSPFDLGVLYHLPGATAERN